MNTATVTPEGQILIPADIIHKFSINAGEKIVFFEQGDKVYFMPERMTDKNGWSQSFWNLYGSVDQEFIEPSEIPLEYEKDLEVMI